MNDVDLYFNRQGNPIEMTEWGRLHGDAAYCIVAQHWVRGWMVSTVWLGLDHGFARMLGRPETPPVIFETMIFPPGDEAGEDGIMSETYQERYSTEAAALAGHDRALAHVREQLGAGEEDVLTADQFRSVPDGEEGDG